MVQDPYATKQYVIYFYSFRLGCMMVVHSFFIHPYVIMSFFLFRIKYARIQFFLAYYILLHRRRRHGDTRAFFFSLRDASAFYNIFMQTIFFCVTTPPICHRLPNDPNECPLKVRAKKLKTIHNTIHA